MRVTRIALLGLLVMQSPRIVAAFEESTGEQIYRRQCASCHGAAGEGTTENYPHPLQGERSVESLARLIAKTMPEDDPGECVGEDADKVAAYIHDAFYSKVAQVRAKPPTIELSRLTVRQYRNAVADLIGTFRPSGHLDGRRGLRGEYFKARRLQKKELVFDRIDPEVRFDFEESSPDPEKFDPRLFSIRWEGSVLAPETGDYEFIVRTEHAARLWVNGTKQPLIDAWVKSGDDTEYRASIFLLGGRAYPIKLDFSKAKQGVDDSKKGKPKPLVKAAIALEWKLPHRPAEVIPQRNLSTDGFPETFVVTTPFPPDDQTVGYERGTSVSKAWDTATTDAAIEVAGFVATHLQELSGVPDGAPDREARLRTFLLKFAERAFRRPLADDLKQRYIDRQFEKAPDPEAAVKRVVLLVLKSPRFLYREIGGGTDPYDVASRISFGLWDSLPDPPLLEAAASGRLATPEQVAGQADRMIADVRSRAKVREFFLRWLKVDQVRDLAKDSSEFPGFNEVIASDLRTSLDLFLEDVVWGEASDFRQLLLADSLYLNGRLARFYGVDLPPDAPFQKVTLDPGERAGVLSHPYLMASFAYTATSSPIHRGVFIARSVLGRTLRPPPDAFTPLAPDLHPNLSTRDRVALQTSPQSCLLCHSMINPLGFALENFDAVGRHRAAEKGKPVDATGSYQSPTGESVQFAGVRELATFLVGSDEAQAAFVQQLFQELVKQPIRAYGPGRLPDLQKSFAGHDFHIRKLVVEIVAASALAERKLIP